MRRLRLRVPREDGSLLALPNLERWPSEVEENRHRWAESTLRIGDLSLSEFRSLARNDAGIRDPDSLLVVTGHQPELFHPGVWAKNFATAGLARCIGGSGLNVVIDNDISKSATIVVPSGSPEDPVASFVPFDRSGPIVPFEEREFVDETVFHRFGVEIQRRLAEFPFEPIVEDFLRFAKVDEEANRTIGERFAAGRRALERSWGCENFEIPLSRLCEGEAFRRLAADLLLRAEQFATVHDSVLAEYRRLNGIRSRTHPAPDLHREGDWFEAPFWTWSRERPRRQRLGVRRIRGAIEFRADREPFATLVVADSDPVGSLAEGLGNGLAGRKLRSRAFVTTLFLRLAVADFFVHGVGGGKYDEVVDALFERFLGVEPPSFGVLSTTVLLPTEQTFPSDEDVRRASRQCRDAYWNPERYLPDALIEADPIADWIERKYSLVEEEPTTRRERRQRFHEFRQLNDRLRQYLGDRLDRLDEGRSQLEDRQEAARLLRSREFSFVLHPEERLRAAFEPLLAFDLKLPSGAR